MDENWHDKLEDKVTIGAIIISILAIVTFLYLVIPLY